jgi:hypothetical protein
VTNHFRVAFVLGLSALLLHGRGASAADSASCAFVAASETRIGNASSVGGDLGANDPGGKVRLGRKVILADGTTVVGDDVRASNGASLFDVAANRFDPGRGVVVRGTLSTPSLPLDDPFCPLPDITCGGADVVVRRSDAPRALSPGQYGDIVLENGTRLELAPGVYDVCSLRAAHGVEIVVMGALPSTINVAGDVRLENGSALEPAPATPTPALNVGGDVRLGAKVQLEAFLAASNAEMRIRHGSSVTGSICAARLTSGHSVTFECSTTVLPTTTTTTSSTSSTTVPATTSTTASTSTTAPSTTTTTSSSSSTTGPTTTSTTTSTSTTAPPTTTTTTSSTSSTTTPTTTTSTTAPPTTTTTTSVPTTTAPTTTSTTTTAPTTSTTTTTTSTSTTSTTQPTTVACGPNGIVARLAVPYDSRTIPALASIRLDVRYPGTVSIPGTGFETDDTRLTIVTGLDGSTIFVDRDDDADGTDETFRVAYALTGGRTFPPGDFADVLLDCSSGTPIDATAFTCGVLDAADPVGTSVPNAGQIPCGVESLTPQ